MRLDWDRSAPQADPWLKGGLAAVGVAALLAARVFPFHVLPTMCAFKIATTHPCLACGMTRSWIHLLHGHPGAAIAQNPLGSALAVAAIAAVLYTGARTFAGMPALRLRTSEKEAWALRGTAIAVILINWLYVAGARVA